MTQTKDDLVTTPETTTPETTTPETTPTPTDATTIDTIKAPDVTTLKRKNTSENNSKDVIPVHKKRRYGELPRLYPARYSTSERPRRNNIKLPSRLWNTVLCCVEYPDGIFIDKHGQPRPDVSVKLPKFEKVKLLTEVELQTLSKAEREEQRNLRYDALIKSESSGPSDDEYNPEDDIYEQEEYDEEEEEEEEDEDEEEEDEEEDEEDEEDEDDYFDEESDCSEDEIDNDDDGAESVDDDTVNNIDE